MHNRQSMPKASLQHLLTPGCHHYDLEFRMNSSDMLLLSEQLRSAMAFSAGSGSGQGLCILERRDQRWSLHVVLQQVQFSEGAARFIAC